MKVGQCQAPANFFRTGNVIGFFQPALGFRKLAAPLGQCRHFKHGLRIFLVRLEDRRQADGSRIIGLGANFKARHVKFWGQICGVKPDRLLKRGPGASDIPGIALCHAKQVEELRIGGLLLDQVFGHDNRLRRLPAFHMQANQSRGGADLPGIHFQGRFQFRHGIARLAAADQAQTQHGMEFRRILGLESLLHQGHGARVLPLRHQCRAQHGHGLTVAWLRFQVGFQDVNGAVRVDLTQVDLRQQFGRRGIALAALESFEVLLGFLTLIEPEVRQSIEHQQLRTVTDEIHGHRIDQSDQAFERGARYFRLVFTLSQQRLQIGRSRLLGRNAHQFLDVTGSIRLTANVNVNSGSRHPRFQMAGIKFDCPVVCQQRARQVSRHVQDGAFLVPGFRQIRRQRQRAFNRRCGFAKLADPNANRYFRQPNIGRLGVYCTRIVNGLQCSARVAKIGACQGTKQEQP